LRVGTSIVLIALGAILRFAVHVTAKGFSLHTIGLILMLVGLLGLILSVLWMTVWTNRTQRTAYVARDVRDVPVRRDRDAY
jgi:Domain of unknown function (DUF6458)